MIIIDDATGKPVTPLQGIRWHVHEIETIDKLMKGRALSIEIRKEFRLYRKRLTENQGRVIMAMNGGKVR